MTTLDPDQAEFEQHRRHLLAQAWRRLMPARFADATVDDLSGDVATTVAAWRTDPTRNLLLLGAVGTGKTHAAAAAARAAHDAGWGVLFLPVAELLDRLRPGGDPDLLDRCAACSLLVLDDLAVERPSDWTAERLYVLINRRWLDRRPTIATANLDRDALEAAVGPRIYSRLVHDALAVSLGGRDRRRRPRSAA